MMVQVRLRCDDKSKAYLERKQQQGKTRRAALRCLKTYVAREVFKFMLTNTKAHPQRWIQTWQQYTKFILSIFAVLTKVMA